MSQDVSDSQLKGLWRQRRILVIFKRKKPLPVLACIPFAEGDMGVDSGWLLLVGIEPAHRYSGKLAVLR